MEEKQSISYTEIVRIVKYNCKLKTTIGSYKQNII
jgi:hypothetical protein